MTMKQTFLGAAGAVLAFSLLAGSGAHASPAAVKADNFMLADQNFLAHDLYRMRDAKAVVLITYAAGSPAVKADAAAYATLNATYAPKGVEVRMLDSTPADDRRAVIAETTAWKLDVPVLFDTNQLVGEQLGVTRTAEVIVLDPKSWRIVYRGPVASAPQALDQLIAGTPVTVASAPAQGALIAFPGRDKAATFASISYAKTIAPMIQQKCAVCHEAGGIGPMPLTTYEQIKGFSPMIREVIRTKRMPPWMADPAVGKWHDDKSLSPEQIKTLVHWIEAGSPRGEGADPLAKIKFQAPEWPLGKPDVVIDIPSYTIPAKGIVDYQYPAVATPLTEARWLRASTIKVSDRQAVHHVLTGLMDGPPSAGLRESNWGSSVGQYAVGSESVIAPKEHGTFIPVGGSIGFQNHYTPYGKETTEKSQIALYFYPKTETPKYVMHNIAIADPSISIRPNTQHHAETAYMEFPKDAIIFGAFPHSHYRGDSSNLSIRYPDGREELLLALPKYNFNWQREYEFATPLKVPAGSKIIARYTYDNSVRNPANPDPNRTVPWGDQSFDEMLYTSLRYRWVDETSSHLQPTYEALLQSGQLMGMLDDNMDGKIELSELRDGPMTAGLKKNFALLDKDHDGSISSAELEVAMKMMGGGGRRRNANRQPPQGTPAPAPAKVASTAGQ